MFQHKSKIVQGNADHFSVARFFDHLQSLLIQRDGFLVVAGLPICFRHELQAGTRFQAIAGREKDFVSFLAFGRVLQVLPVHETEHLFCLAIDQSFSSRLGLCGCTVEQPVSRLHIVVKDDARFAQVQTRIISGRRR